MNKLIQELEDQCWVQVPCDFDMRKGGLSTINTVFDRKKFAELIVKEMCDMMRQCQDDCDTGDASETNWGYIGQLQDWIDRFEKHFGVKNDSR